MEKKSFIILICLMVGTFGLTQLVRHYRAPAGLHAQFDHIPLNKGEWVGRMEKIPEPIVEMLSPDEILSASFTNSSGNKVQLFVDYYAPENSVGSIHSPRNCLPGSGWVIAGSEPNTIEFGGRQIDAVRFYLALGSSRQVMDFWYITRFGETANDFRLKFNTMVSSLVLRPTDKAFVRFVTDDDSRSVAAMEEFEGLFIGEVYKGLPF